MSLSYTNRDMDTIRAELISQISELTDKWTDHSESDLGVVLIEFIASVSDFLSFYMDRQALETYIDTAIQEKNIRSLLRVMNYHEPLKGAAKGYVRINFETPATKSGFISRGTKFSSSNKISYVSMRSAQVSVGDTKVDILVYQGEKSKIEFTRKERESSVNPRRISLDSLDVAEGTVVVSQTGVVWEECEDALLKYRGGYYYSIHRDSEGIAYVLFSPNCLELFPKDENEKVEISFLNTLGTKGIVSSGSITRCQDTLDISDIVGADILSIENIGNTYGAWDDIDLQQAKVLARRNAQTMDRYITLGDYEVGVRKQPYVMDCVVKDWKDSKYVSQPYLVSVWAVDNDGNSLGVESAKELKNELMSKGVSTVQVEVMPTEIVKFDVDIILFISSSRDDIVTKVKELVMIALQENFGFRSLKYGKRVSINQIASVVMSASNYIEDVEVKFPDSDINVSAIQYPKLGDINISVG